MEEFVPKKKKKCVGNERLKAENGRMWFQKDAVRERWVEYFESLLNETGG